MTEPNNSDLFERLAPSIANCIEKLGSAEFYPLFFQMMKALAPIEQYMVFEFSPNTDYVACRLAHNLAEPELGVELASRYLEGAYLEDELLKQLKEKVLSDPDSPPCTMLEKRTLPRMYRRKFFNIPNLDTKFSFVVVDKESGHLFYINFYNKHEIGFDESRLNDLSKVSGIVGALLLKHFQGERKQRGTVRSLLISGLSEREAQVCDMMLKGHTAKSISIELGVSESTIITYKKRAFEKLNINLKSELIKFV